MSEDKEALKFATAFAVIFICLLIGVHAVLVGIGEEFPPTTIAGAFLIFLSFYWTSKALRAWRRL